MTVIELVRIELFALLNQKRKEKSSGGQTVLCTAEIHEFIAFVKEGSDVINIF